MDEVNAVKDILKDALSRIDGIQSPSQASQTQNPQNIPQQQIPESLTSLLVARAQNNFR